jgi:hypothetical protein
MALLTALAFVWVRFGLFVNFVRQLGTTSLLVYWVHVELVYGAWLRFLKRRLTGVEAALATLAVMVVMYWLSIAKTRYWPQVKNAFAPRTTREPSPAGHSAEQATASGRPI